MPAEANVRIDRQAPAENAANDNDSITPLRKGITTVEHKIRNLEKRKAKLESYKALQNSGKDLNQDQKSAVAKYDEVITTLECTREICKSLVSIAVSSEKEARKLARKEAVAKSQAELAKVREILLVQDALTQMGQETTREDFLRGRNGAAQLEEFDLKVLDEFYTAVTPKHEPGDSQIFCGHIQSAAEHLLAVVDGKEKEICGSTYGHVKEVIGKIHESGYFDQVQDQLVEVVDENVTELPVEDVINNEVIPNETLPPIDTLNIETIQQPPQPMPPVQQVDPAMVPISDPAIFYQQPPPPPQQQQPRQLSDVLEPGSFSFLQDSELDTPPEIPTQTYTNQTFVQGPPPPIPMPPHFQPYAAAPVPPQQMVPPPAPQQQPPQQVIQQQQQAPQVIPQNNVDDQHDNDDMQKQRGRPRANNQPYYAHNNGYNIRTKGQNRNGPRSGNRHQ